MAPSFSSPIAERSDESAYADGPVELIPGIWIGQEDSVHRFDIYGRQAKTVRILNVAQEIDDPFQDDDASGSSTKIRLASYPAVDDHPQVEYAHLRWSHGEGGLAEIPHNATLQDLMDVGGVRDGAKEWRFWEAVRYMEEGRRRGIPILIQCVGILRGGIITYKQLPMRSVTIRDSGDRVYHVSGSHGPHAEPSGSIGGDAGYVRFRQI